MTQLYAEHYYRPHEEFEQATDCEHFMAAEESLEWRLIDRVLMEHD